MADVVAPNGAELRKIASSYLDAAKRLQTYGGKLLLIKITPGSLDAGQQLKKAWTDRIDRYRTFIEDLQYAIYWTGQNLGTIAQKYQDTEDLNKDDAKRVDELIHALSAKFPEVSGLIGSGSNP